MPKAEPDTDIRTAKGHTRWYARSSGALLVRDDLPAHVRETVAGWQAAGGVNRPFYVEVSDSTDAYGFALPPGTRAPAWWVTAVKIWHEAHPAPKR